MVKIRKFRYLDNNRGFTLTEVIASIVIIAILLISFFQVFIQNNKTAVYNNERLVVINLAHAELERLKIDPFTSGVSTNGKIKKPTTIGYTDSTTKTSTINNRDYTIQINAKQSNKEKDLKLINVTVTAISSNGKTKNSVEGYIEYE